MRLVLIGACTFTLFATAYLTLSIAILRPPRVHYGVWILLATLFTAQSALTVLFAATDAPRPRMRWVLAAGAVLSIGVGGWWALSALRAPHFEGYALVLGSAVVVQGLLTLTAPRRSL